MTAQNAKKVPEVQVDLDNATQPTQMRFVILGHPIAKKRHRTTRGRGGRIRRTYDPQADEKETVKWVMRSKMKEGYLRGPLDVEMIFWFQRPKSVKRLEHTVKPDVDNVAKFYMDCGNGIIWKDDAQIVGLKCEKRYGEPRVEIKATNRLQPIRSDAIHVTAPSNKKDEE